MNLPRLKGIIRERGKNYVQCSKEKKKSVASFNSKMNGRVAFTIVELEDLGDFLEMTGDEKREVYLS